jgi:hypothetical protein
VIVHLTTVGDHWQRTVINCRVQIEPVILLLHLLLHQLLSTVRQFAVVVVVLVVIRARHFDCHHPIIVWHSIIH